MVHIKLHMKIFMECPEIVSFRRRCACWTLIRLLTPLAFQMMWDVVLELNWTVITNWLMGKQSSTVEFWFQIFVVYSHCQDYKEKKATHTESRKESYQKI